MYLCVTGSRMRVIRCRTGKKQNSYIAGADGLIFAGVGFENLSHSDL